MAPIKHQSLFFAVKTTFTVKMIDVHAEMTENAANVAFF